MNPPTASISVTDETGSQVAPDIRRLTDSMEDISELEAKMANLTSTRASNETMSALQATKLFGAESGPRMFLDAVAKGKLHLAKFIAAASDNGNEILNARDSEGKTALIRAVVSIPEIRTRTKMIEMLLDKGAQTDLQDKEGKTALYYACESHTNELVKILIKRGVDPNLPDKDGCTPLIMCCRVGNDIGTEILVKCYRRLGLDVDHVDASGLTALMTAFKHGYHECARILIHLGKASLTKAGGSEGLNPIEWALKNGCSQEEINSVTQKQAADDLLTFRSQLNAVRTGSNFDSDQSTNEDVE